MKYVNNSFHALKVSFANEIGNICQALQIDSHKVMEIFCKDKVLNISPYYLKPGFAYGGSCLPKDLKALQTLSHDLYLNTPVINQVSNTNNHQIERAIDIIVQKGFKKLGFLGLSFKAGTDDLRNSPAVFLIETLLGKGFDIQIYDKNIELSRLLGKNKEYIDTHIPHLSKLLVNNIDTLVEKSELIIKNNKQQDYLDNLSSHLESIHLIDMVRLPEEFRKAKYYMGINW
jgi:GDP-mannose 6-dehydrogenase